MDILKNDAYQESVQAQMVIAGINMRDSQGTEDLEGRMKKQADSLKFELDRAQQDMEHNPIPLPEIIERDKERRLRDLDMSTKRNEKVKKGLEMMIQRLYQLHLGNMRGMQAYEKGFALKEGDINRALTRMPVLLSDKEKELTDLLNAEQASREAAFSKISTKDVEKELRDQLSDIVRQASREYKDVAKRGEATTQELLELVSNDLADFESASQKQNFKLKDASEVATKNLETMTTEANARISVVGEALKKEAAAEARFPATASAQLKQVDRQARGKSTPKSASAGRPGSASFHYHPSVMVHKQRQRDFKQKHEALDTGGGGKSNKSGVLQIIGPGTTIRPIRHRS